MSLPLIQPSTALASDRPRESFCDPPADTLRLRSDSEFEFTRTRSFQTGPANFFVRPSIVFSYRFDRRCLYILFVPPVSGGFRAPIYRAHRGLFHLRGVEL